MWRRPFPPFNQADMPVGWRTCASLSRALPEVFCRKRTHPSDGHSESATRERVVVKLVVVASCTRKLALSLTLRHCQPNLPRGSSGETELHGARSSRGWPRTAATCYCCLYGGIVACIHGSEVSLSMGAPLMGKRECGLQCSSHARLKYF